MLADASPPPARTCTDRSAPTPGYSCSLVWMGDLYPILPHTARVLVDASLPPARRTWPDRSALTPGCSCSSVWMDALLPGIISLSLIYKETHCRYLPSCG